MGWSDVSRICVSKLGSESGPMSSGELRGHHRWPKFGYSVLCQLFSVERVSGKNLFKGFAVFGGCYDHTSSAGHLWARCNKVPSSIVFFEEFYVSVELGFDFLKRCDVMKINHEKILFGR